MAYNINLANYLNNVSNNINSTRVDSTSQENAAGQANRVSSGKGDTSDLIKGMFVGDVFTGEVLSSDENSVSIRTAGKTLMASITQNTGMPAKGDMLTFLVADKSEDKISLKTLDTPAQEVFFASRALEESNLAINQSNLDMVRGLINQNMPIDKNTLNDMARIMSTYPDADMDTLTRLYKLEMPINEDNIKQFDAYKLYEHDMTGTINNLAEDFSKLVDSLINQGNADIAAGLTSDLLDILTQGYGNEADISNNPDNYATNADVNQNAALEGTMADNNGEAVSLNNHMPDTNVSNVFGNIEGKSNDEIINDIKSFINDESITNEEKNSSLMQLLGDDSLPAQVKSAIISGADFKEFLQKQLKDNFFIKPEDVSDKGEVKDFYKRMLKVAAEGESVLAKHGLAESDMAKGMHSVKSNVEFMNDLNHQMAFMQIPIKLQDGQARGDLYVYTNRKNKNAGSDELTALLHLDMNNLGPMDIYVKMSGHNNVSTNFCLESEEMLDFIYEHIDILTERLNAKGYNFNPTMTVKDNDDKTQGKKGDVDFEKDFLDVVDPVIPITRYLFDTKA